MSITIVTSDGERIEVDSRIKSVSRMLETLEIADKEETPVNIDATKFRHVLEFCMFHDFKSPEPAEKPMKSTNLEELIPSEWARNFLADISMRDLSEFITAVDYLDIPSLFSYCAVKIALEFKQKSVIEIKDKYGIAEELDMGQEMGLFREFPWLTEKFGN